MLLRSAQVSRWTYTCEKKAISLSNLQCTAAAGTEAGQRNTLHVKAWLLHYTTAGARYAALLEHLILCVGCLGADVFLLCASQLPVEGKQLLCYPTRLAIVDTTDSVWDDQMAYSDSFVTMMDGLKYRRLLYHVFLVAAVYAEASV